MKTQEAMLAGGPLLKGLSDSIDSTLTGCIKKHDSREEFASCMKGELSRRVIKLVLGGDWRRFLEGSLKMTNQVLTDVSRAYERVYDHVVDLQFKLIDRGLVGTGSGLFASIFEVGLGIDWILGLPYYPASTVKGAVRSAAEELLGTEAAERLFGSLGARGSMAAVVFSDAYPVGCLNRSRHPCLIVTGDVITPHYFRPKWGKVVDAELEAGPTPIQHLAIAPGTVFRVVVGLDVARIRSADEVVKRAIERNLLSKKEVELGNMALLLLMARLVAAALASGFAARSGKGYNVLLPLLEGEDVHRVIVSLSVRRGSG